MDAKTIYDELLKQGIPEKLVRWSNKADSIDMLIQDYNEKVYKEALKFFKDYKGVRVDYTIDHETALLCDDVSKYSSDELIRSLTDFYYTLRTKGLAYTESKKSARKSLKESKYKVGDFKNTSNRQISISYVNEEDNPLWVGSPDELNDCDYLNYDVEEVGEEGKTLYLSIEESKKSARKSIKESADDIITVKEFCFWGHSGNIVEIWTIDGVLCDSFEVRNVGKSEYKNYEIHGWDCAKNTVIIYIKK